MNGLCSHERLELALAGSLDADEESALHRHLDDCESCSAEMERLSGGEQAIREIASMLMPSDLNDALPPREEWSAADFVVDHLEPSDDPSVMGRLGGYDVLEIIGRGGMGIVLKGFDRELKRFVAIKALAPHLAHSALARKRFAREAQAAAAVVNPHVIAIHQVQPNGQLPFLVMPLLTGESLAQRMKSRGALELQETLRIGMQAAEGLAAAHGQGLIHRDVKPANILLEKGVERAVLTDFGLARAADDVSMTRWGIIAGTPEYMSPEQARGEVLDGRSDLFGLGCVLYEMATGVSPFRTDSTMATLRRIVDQQPAAMASLVPELPTWFRYIVERLLSKDPARRFASASEVSQLLEQCLSHLQQPASVPLPASLAPHATGRRSFFNATRKGVIAMLGTIGMTLLGLVLWQSTEAPDISGQWISDEWGTVVLEAKGPGRYEGTFSGSGMNKSDARNSTLGADTGVILDVPALGPNKDKPDPRKATLSDSDVIGAMPSVRSNKDNPEIFYFHAGLDRQISSKDHSGTFHLKWSRVERRFNGTWGKHNDRSGKLSLRLVGNEIRGAWTTSEKSERSPGTPKLADLAWKRSSVTQADAVPGIRVRVLLSADTHSREMMRKNIGFDRLSIMGSGITGTVNGKTHDNIQAVMAHDCRLESFNETKDGDKRYWDATLFVPQDSKSDGSNLDLSQKRIDGMLKEGVKFWLDHQRDTVAKPVVLSESSRATQDTSPATSATEVQIKIAAPQEMEIVVADQRGKFGKSPRLVAPARLNLHAGKSYRLKLTNIAGREGAEFYPTMEIGPTAPGTAAFLAHSLIPIEFAEEDFDQALVGNLVTKVIYLPDSEFQDLALPGVETLVSTRLEPGKDPVAEADRRGSVLAVIRLGNKDIELRGGSPPPQILDDIRLKLNFNSVVWKDVVEWLAKTANLTLVADRFPSGTCNYRDSQPRTVPETIDVLNGMLRLRGFFLLREDQMLIVRELEDGAGKTIDLSSRGSKPDETRLWNAYGVTRAPVSPLTAKVLEWSGLHLDPITNDAFRDKNVLAKYPGGLDVTFVRTGGPAEKAGVHEVDIVVGLQGRSLASLQELDAAMHHAVEQIERGDAVALQWDVLRDGETVRVSVPYPVRERALKEKAP